MKKLTVNLKDIGDVEVNVPEGCTVKLDGSHICVVKEEKEVLTWEEIISIMPNSSMMWHTLGNGNIARDYINDIDRMYYRNWVNTQRQAEKLRAIAQLMVIADYYNKTYANGWVADYRDLGQEKFYPDWGNASHNPSFHSFHACSGCTPAFASVELIKKAYENNKEIFETALKP